MIQRRSPLDAFLHFLWKSQHNGWFFQPPSDISAGLLVTHRLRGNQQTLANDRETRRETRLSLTVLWPALCLYPLLNHRGNQRVTGSPCFLGSQQPRCLLFDFMSPQRRKCGIRRQSGPEAAFNRLKAKDTGSHLSPDTRSQVTGCFNIFLSKSFLGRGGRITCKREVSGYRKIGKTL